MLNPFGSWSPYQTGGLGFGGPEPEPYDPWGEAYPGGYQTVPRGLATPVGRPGDQFWNGPYEGPMQTRSWPPSVYGRNDPAQDFWNWILGR